MSESRNKLKANCSIIVLSYNRHDRIKEVIAKYNNSNKKVFIADGSDSAISKDEYENYSNIIYLHRPGINTYVDRLIETLKQVETEYFILLDDEDLLFPRAFELILDKIDGFSDVATIGKVFILNNQESIPLLPWPGGTNLSIKHTDPVVRISNMIETEVTAYVFYSLISKMRVDSIVAILEASCKLSKNLTYKNIEIIWTSAILANYTFNQESIPQLVRKSNNNFDGEKTNRREILWNTLDFIFLIILLKKILTLKKIKFEAHYLPIIFLTSFRHLIKHKKRRIKLKIKELSQILKIEKKKINKKEKLSKLHKFDKNYTKSQIMEKYPEFTKYNLQDDLEIIF